MEKDLVTVTNGLPANATYIKEDKSNKFRIIRKSRQKVDKNPKEKS